MAFQLSENCFCFQVSHATALLWLKRTFFFFFFPEILGWIKESLPAALSCSGLHLQV